MVTPTQGIKKTKKLVIQPEPKDTLFDPNGGIFLSASGIEEEGGKKTEFNYTVETHSLPSGSDISTI